MCLAYHLLRLVGVELPRCFEEIWTLWEVEERNGEIPNGIVMCFETVITILLCSGIWPVDLREFM